jgi:IS1 family transposase
MNKLDIHERAKLLGLLVEGNSLRSTSRLADVSINTVTKLFVNIGKACALYQNATFKNLNCQRMQVDEIWSFCYAKQKNLRDAKNAPENAGDVYGPDTKIVPTWLVGKRDADHAKMFIADLAERIPGRFQLTSDGFAPYYDAVQGLSRHDIDYAMLIKIYGTPKGQPLFFSSNVVTTAEQKIIGKPDFRHISTSLVERQNLTMRMSMRRFTRKTNGFSKKIENHAYAVALHFMYYNFARIHKTLRITPAMAAGISKHVWSLEEIIQLIENRQSNSTI